MHEKIKDAPGFVKNGKAIVNTDYNALLAYKQRRNKLAQEEAIQKDINNIKERLHRIERFLGI